MITASSLCLLHVEHMCRQTAAKAVAVQGRIQDVGEVMWPWNSPHVIKLVDGGKQGHAM